MGMMSDHQVCPAVNRQMSNHGRGRLMVRELCNGIERKRFGCLNETVYHVRLNGCKAEKELEIDKQ